MFYKSKISTLETIGYNWIYIGMSIGLWAQEAFSLMNCYIGLLGQVIYRICISSRASRIKETLPDFHEKCRVT